MPEPLDALLALSHRIGLAGDLAILGEGNTSAKTGDDTFLVKASGSSLATLAPDQLAECRLSTLMRAIDGPELPDKDVDDLLMASRVSPRAKKPSVEAYFHAYLLSLPKITFVAHCHPEAVNPILCSPHAERFATHRQCPDEIVCCGAESLYLPYIDPGLKLARILKTAIKDFVSRTGKLPKVILLGNHGVITPANSANAAWAALAMICKAARIYRDAQILGGSKPIPPQDIARLDGRPDEDYRRAVLGL